MQPIEISFVIPCLNEKITLAKVIRDIHAVGSEFKAYEVIVADNGSIDGSQEIAVAEGARVVSVPVKGYGAALQGGIMSANFDVVVFADADHTYDFLETPKLVAALVEKKLDIVLGDRINGIIQKGAMPILHRYLGTPVLSMLISVLVGHRLGLVRDCNSGFRVFKKNKFETWAVRSTGMEFASEMLIKAIRTKSLLGWVPVTLRADERGRIPHLRTWRDGMRHLLQILVNSPVFMKKFGALASCVSLLTIALSFSVGSIDLGAFRIFGIHTAILSTLVFTLGAQLYFIGILIDYVEGNKVSRLISLDEGRLFWIALLFSLISFFLVLYFFVTWSNNNFKFLDVEKLALFSLFTGLIGVYSMSSLIVLHLVKRLVGLSESQKLST